MELLILILISNVAIAIKKYQRIVGEVRNLLLLIVRCCGRFLAAPQYTKYSKCKMASLEMTMII